MLPTLPTEIWTRILSIADNEQDLPQAWMSHRFVSQAFKTAVEDRFRDQHLRKTRIVLHLGTIQDDEDTTVVLSINFQFSHLSPEDKDIAIFTASKLLPEKHQDAMIIRLKIFDKDEIELPKHYVYVHREMNDTPIPGLSLDFENMTLSCDWKGLYTRFYGEEVLYTTYTKEWVASQEAWMKDMQQKVVRGQMDMGLVLEQAITAFGDNAEVSRIRARRVRIGRQWAERGEVGGSEVDKYDEKKAMQRIAKVRQIASMADDSDFDEEDDDEEDEDEEDEEDDEGDGWETDDSEGSDEGEEENESDEEPQSAHA